MIQKHKIVVFFISLLAAVIFWLFVVTTVAPDTIGTVGGINVSMIGDTTLEARGLMVTSLDNETVWVELQTSRATLSKLNSGNMNATLDVSRITEAGDYDLSYSVYYPDTVNTGDIQLLRKSTDKIHVTVSAIATKTLPMELQWSGQVQEGYLFDEGQVSFEPDSVTLQGPDYEVNEVARVVAAYDVSDLTEPVSLQTEPIFLDALGNEITLSDLTTVSTSEISMTVPVSQYKDLELLVELSYGAGVSEENSEVTLDHDTIRVSGDAEVIDALGESITLGTIDLTQAVEGQEYVFPLHLPKGVQNISGEQIITAKVHFTGLIYRNYSVTDIELQNQPEDFDVELSTRTVTVRLRGSKSVLDAISAEDIHVQADLSNIAQTGTQTIKATVTIDGDPDVGVVGEIELTITVS